MQVIVDYSLRIAGVLAIFFVAQKLGGLVQDRAARQLESRGLDATVARFVSSIAKYAVLLLGVICALSLFGIETTSFAAVLGAAGLAVGLAFQGSLSNVAAGIMLVILRPYRANDFVKLGGTAGSVVEIGIMTTTLKTPDNRQILVVPNSSILGSTIEVVTAYETRRVDVSVGVAYDADLATTRAALNQAVAATPNVLPDPEHAIVLTGLGASSVDWVVRVWAETGDYWAVKEELTSQVKQALDAAKIGIPYQTLDVNLTNAG